MALASLPIASGPIAQSLTTSSSSPSLAGSIIGKSVFHGNASSSLSFHSSIVGNSLSVAPLFEGLYLISDIVGKSFVNGNVGESGILGSCNMLGVSFDSALVSLPIHVQSIVKARSLLITNSIQELQYLTSHSIGQLYSAAKLPTIYLNIKSEIRGKSVESASLAIQYYIQARIKSNSIIQASHVNMPMGIISGIDGTSKAILSHLSLALGTPIVVRYKGYSQTTSNMFASLGLHGSTHGSSKILGTPTLFQYLSSLVDGKSISSTSLTDLKLIFSTAIGRAALQESLSQVMAVDAAVYGSAKIAAALFESLKITSSYAGKGFMINHGFYQNLAMHGLLNGYSSEQVSGVIQKIAFVSQIDGSSKIEPVNLTLTKFINILAQSKGYSTVTAYPISMEWKHASSMRGISIPLAHLSQALALDSTVDGESKLGAFIQNLILIHSSSAGNSSDQGDIVLLNGEVNAFPYYYVATLPNNEVWVIVAGKPVVNVSVVDYQDL